MPILLFHSQLWKLFSFKSLQRPLLLPPNWVCAALQFAALDFRTRALLWSHPPRPHAIAARWDDAKHTAPSFLPPFAVPKKNVKKNALNIRIVLKYATTSVIVGRSTHQFLRFLYEFVVQRDEGIAQCLCRPLGIVLAGRDFAMHVRYRICSRICATMTIEYGIVIRLRRRLFASHQCTPHTTDKEDETKKNK